jgi:hypothetical protein
MIKLRPLISELTQDQKERKKDYLFKQAKLTASNTVPSWSKVWDMFLRSGDSFTRALEDMKMAYDNKYESEDEDTLIQLIEEEQRQKYFQLVEEYKELDGATCWRTITIPENVDPVGIPQLGIYWSIEESSAEAHWGHGKNRPLEVTYDGIIDLHNVDWPGTMFARMDFTLGDDEKEIRFIKNSPIFVPRCHTYHHGRVNRHLIGDWRRT